MPCIHIIIITAPAPSHVTYIPSPLNLQPHTYKTLTDDEIVFFEDDVGDERDEIESLVLASVQLDNDDQQVGPREHGALANGTMTAENGSLNVDGVISHP